MGHGIQPLTSEEGVLADKAKDDKAGPEEAADEAGKKKKDDKAKGKGKDEKEEKKPKEARPKVTKEHKPDFKFIVRLAETDLNGERAVQLALSDIRGIGMRTAALVADHVGVPRKMLIGDLSDEQVEKLGTALAAIPEYIPVWMLNRQNDIDSGADVMVYGPELGINVREDINLMKKIRCYKGIRHETGQKVRGQRTKSNGRTGLTVGVTKKAMQAAAAAAKSEEGGKKEKGGEKKAEAAAPAAAAAAPKKEEKKAA
jgi:small subunit ribosomal protein S13